MNTKQSPSEVDMVACDICRKEVPLSEAKVPYAVDYVAHFCGLECYDKWKRESDAEEKQGDG